MDRDEIKALVVGEVDIMTGADLDSATPASNWETAETVTEFIHRDPLYRSLSETQLREALRDGEPGEPADADALTGRIRRWAERDEERRRRERENGKEPAPDPERDRNAEIGEATTWSYFFQAWECYRKRQDLALIYDLPLKFLATWIESNDKFISEEELTWCERKAEETVHERKSPGSMQGYEHNAAYCEAVVALVMRKFLKSSRTKPEETAAFMHRHMDALESAAARLGLKIRTVPNTIPKEPRFRCNAIERLPEI